MKLKSFTIFFSLFLCSQSFAETVKDPLWEKYVSSEVLFQIRWADLLIYKAPHLKDLIEIRRDLHLAKIERRTFRYYYLFERKPFRITRDDGLLNWMIFDWELHEEEYLNQSNDRYRYLTLRRKKLVKLNNGHPQSLALNKVFIEVANTPEGKELLRKLKRTRREIDLELKSNYDK